MSELPDELQAYVDEIDAYAGEVDPQWSGLLAKIVDKELRYEEGSSEATRGGQWWITANALARMARAHTEWEINGAVTEPHWGPVDERRLADLLEGSIGDEADRRVFVAVCSRITRELRYLFQKARLAAEYGEGVL